MSHVVCIPSSILMVLLLLLPCTFGIPASDVTSICSTTRDPASCTKFLNSNSGTAGADLKGVAQIAIGMAKSSAASAATLAGSLAGKATDPVLKGRYQTCAKNFDNAKSSLDECTSSLSSGDFTGLNMKASAAMEGPTTCSDSFQGPPADPSELPAKSKELISHCSTILAISKRLIG